MSSKRQRLNLSNPVVKSEVLSEILAAEGWHWIEVSKARRTKTAEQLGYLFGVVYPGIREALWEAWGERKPVWWVHEAMKEMLLRDEIVNEDTGEVRMGGVRSVADLNVSEMCEYIDACIGWAWHELGYKVKDADKNYWRKEAA